MGRKLNSKAEVLAALVAVEQEDGGGRCAIQLGRRHIRVVGECELGMKPDELHERLAGLALLVLE